MKKRNPCLWMHPSWDIQIEKKKLSGERVICYFERNQIVCFIILKCEFDLWSLLFQYERSRVYISLPLPLHFVCSPLKNNNSKIENTMKIMYEDLCHFSSLCTIKDGKCNVKNDLNIHRLSYFLGYRVMQWQLAASRKLLGFPAWSCETKKGRHRHKTKVE